MRNFETCLTLAVVDRRALLVGRAGNHRGRAHHIVGCSFVARNFVARHHSNPARRVAAGADSRAAGNRPGRNLAAEDMGSGPGAGTAGSPGCTDRKDPTF